MALGRRRDARVDEALMAATRQVLREAGYAGLTVDAVAARAGIGKAAIYRRFPAKEHMILAAAVHGLDFGAPGDTGSLREDLAALHTTIRTHMSHPSVTTVLPHLVAETRGDAELSERFLESFLYRQREGVRVVLERAVERGELAGVPDLDLVYALLHGPLFVWLFVLRRPVDGSDFTDLLDTVTLAALTHLGTSGDARPA